MAIDKALHTGRATSTGGRTGITESDGGVLKAVTASHEVCRYSNATRGSINVALTVA